jgi:hypothetical protein
MYNKLTIFLFGFGENEKSWFECGRGKIRTLNEGNCTRETEQGETEQGK